MDWYLRQQEALQSLIRRYEAPDEYPFFPDAIGKPILKPLNYPRILHPNDVNVNGKIKEFYTSTFLPAAVMLTTTPRDSPGRRCTSPRPSIRVSWCDSRFLSQRIESASSC